MAPVFFWNIKWILMLAAVSVCLGWLRNSPDENKNVYKYDRPYRYSDSYKYYYEKPYMPYKNPRYGRWGWFLYGYGFKEMPAPPNPSPPSVPDGLTLVFHDDFSEGFNTDKWEHEITASGGGNWQFQIYSPEKANTYVRDGVLYLKPTLTADHFGEDFLTKGELNVTAEWGECTQHDFFGCYRNSKFGIIPPVLSSMVKSKKSFKYGRVEVEAQMPIGDWLWPAIWLYPKKSVYGVWPRSGEIDMAETRGNLDYGDDGIQKMLSTLHWGPHWSANGYLKTAGMRRLTDGSNWGDNFHLYSLDWNQTNIVLSVDNHIILNAPTPTEGYWKFGQFSGEDIWKDGGKDAPFDQEFFIQMNVAVGGTNGYFSDTVMNKPYEKPWKNNDGQAAEAFWNSSNLWYPTWKGEGAAMKVRSVRIYSKI